MVRKFQFRWHLVCCSGPNIPSHVCETCHVSEALFFYQGLVCTSDRISRAVLCWRSCNHNGLTLQNEPMCSWPVWQVICSRITLLLEAKVPEMMLLHSLLSLSLFYNSSLPELQILYWWEAPCSASPENLPGCSSLSQLPQKRLQNPPSNEQNRESQQVPILFTSSGQPNRVEFTSSHARCILRV